MTPRKSILNLLMACALPACHSQPSEPAPPPARYELTMAPPGARGARAAGTDAAPPPPTELGTPEPDEPSDSDDDETDAGEPDAGAAVADDGGVPL